MYSLLFHKCIMEEGWWMKFIVDWPASDEVLDDKLGTPGEN